MRALRLVLKIGVGAIVGYYVLINGLLLSPLGEKLMNLAPDMVEMHYRRAYSLYPLHVKIYGWTMRAQDPNMQMYITADEVSAVIYPWTALTDLKVTATHVYGDGLMFWLRIRKMPGDVPPDEHEALAPIPGFNSVARDVPGGPPPSDKNYDLVQVEMTDMHVTHLKQVWIDQYRYDGDIQLDGGFYFKPTRTFRLDPTHMTLQPGELHHGLVPLADHFGGEIQVELVQSNLGEITRAFAAGLTTSTELGGHLTSVKFLNYYFRDIPQIRFDDGAGDVHLKLRIARGLLEPDCELSVDPKHLVVHVPYFSARGTGRVRWNVKKGKAWLDVALKDVAVKSDHTGKVVLHGPRMSVQAQSTGVDLAQDVHLDVVLDLEETKADDLSFLNEFIPERSGMHVSKGEGTVKGNLELSTKTQHGRGVLEIESKQVELKTARSTVKGEVSAKGQLKDFDMKKSVFDLSTSRIELNHARVAVENKVYEDFWAHVQCDACVLSPEKDPIWTSHPSVAVKNLQPLLGFVGSLAPLPWVVRQLNVSDVRATADFEAYKAQLRLHNLVATAGPLKVEGWLDLKLKDKKQEPFGALRLSLGELSAVLDLQGTKTNVKLIGSDKWFAEQRAARDAKDAKPGH